MVTNFLYRECPLKALYKLATDRIKGGGNTLKILDACKTYGRSTKDTLKSIICNTSNGKSSILTALVPSHVIVGDEVGGMSQMVKVYISRRDLQDLEGSERPRTFHHGQFGELCPASMSGSN
jgi:hypothetical protein